MAELSLRELAARTNVSNPYLSQIERGLHEPSVRVLKAIATALNVSAESLLTQAGLLEDEGDASSEPAAPLSTAETIASDPDLTPEQRTALLAVYQSYLDANDAEEVAPGAKKPRARGTTRGSSKNS
jgi:transcriptional regulator with XRE-family HTH domain